MISRSHLRVASTGDYIACKGPISDAQPLSPDYGKPEVMPPGWQIALDKTLPISAKWLQMFD
jgi:hypothetical protein